eukprot:gene3303-5060_t
MTTTFGTFNYRAAKGQQSDPVRAQGDSIVKLVSLFKKHLQSPGESGTDQTTSNASSSFDITDVKSQIMEVLTIIMATEDGRLELQSILEEQKRSVATLLLAERKLVLNGRTAAAAVQAIYYREIEKVAAAATGATRTFCNGHVIRKSGDSDGPLGKLFTAIAGPIQFVHNDFCDDYNQNIINAFKDDPVPVGSSMSHSGINNADSYRASSGGGGGAKPGSATFGIVDQMKAAGVTAEELANSRMVELCRSSVGGAGKFGKSASMGGDSSLEFYSSLYSSQHEWYWFPQMLNTEVLLIKTYDSDPSSGVFHPTLHSAFNDESTSPDAPERQSCEARVLCLIPKSSPKL